MNRPRILIVDDEPDIVKGLTLRLRASGFDVMSAGDGLQATRIAINDPPDVILLDVGLPGGSGLVVAQRLRAHPATMQVPIIFLTARSGTEDFEAAHEAGVDKYITKPYRPDVVVAAIEECLETVTA